MTIDPFVIEIQLRAYAAVVGIPYDPSDLETVLRAAGYTRIRRKAGEQL